MSIEGDAVCETVPCARSSPVARSRCSASFAFVAASSVIGSPICCARRPAARCPPAEITAEITAGITRDHTRSPRDHPRSPRPAATSPPAPHGTATRARRSLEPSGGRRSPTPIPPESRIQGGFGPVGGVVSSPPAGGGRRRSSAPPARDAHEMRTRCARDAPEMRPRRAHDALTRDAPRCARDAPEIDRDAPEIVRDAPEIARPAREAARR